MRSLPGKAQAFIAIIIAAGTLALLAACLLPGPHAKTQSWELWVFLVLSIAAGGKKVRLLRAKSDDEAGSMQLGCALTFAALLNFGPAIAVLVGVLNSLSSSVYPRRQPLHHLLFNGALAAVEAWLSSQVFLFFNGGTLQLEPVRSFPAVVAASIAFFLINTGGVATIIALCSRQNIVTLWKQSFLWSAPSQFAGACISTLAVLLFGRHIGAVLLFISPVAYVMYQSYAIASARTEERQQHSDKLADLYLSTIKSLALAIDAKDRFTHQHILRVQRYAVATARRMGLAGTELAGINTGALLHDIGKLGVPEYVLLKPGRLTDEEFGKIKKHPEIGAAILGPVEFPWPVLPVVKYHHERWDGTGYPEGLKGEAIPLTARVLAVADVYDALTSSRSYRDAWTHERALALIKNDGGTHFDPVVVDAFLEVIDEIVEEMAREGYGPLALRNTAARPAPSKADMAAQDIQRASSEFWALYEVAQTLGSNLSLEETLRILARKLEAVFPGTACLFLLRGDTDDTLVARAAEGINQDFFEGCRTLNSASISLRVAQTRETYLGSYDPDDLLLISSPHAQWETLRAGLIVPIVHQGEVLGTINLYHSEPNAFTLDDRQLLEIFAERAAMTLYNGLLFDRTRSHALTDPLTGLYNVRFLTQHVDERCQKALAAPDREEGFALLCLDLDSFKPINDNFGHQKGDEVLCCVSKLLRSLLHDDSAAVRYGGDEFLIVLDGALPLQAEAMARQLQKAVEEYDPGLIHSRVGALHLGVSVGYACFPSDGQDCATLLSAANSRMYQDKTERKLLRLADKVIFRTSYPQGAETAQTLPRAA